MIKASKDLLLCHTLNCLNFLLVTVKIWLTVEDLAPVVNRFASKTCTLLAKFIYKSRLNCFDFFFSRVPICFQICQKLIYAMLKEIRTLDTRLNQNSKD